MSAITFDEVLRDAKALSASEQQRLLQLLTGNEQEAKPAKRIEQLVAAQGTRPLNFEEMLGDFWPEEESAEEFLTTLREWRNEAEQRSLK